MTATAYLVHLHAPFGHAQHYLGWSEQHALRLGHHARGTGSNLLRHVNAAGITWSLVRLWPGATRTVERQLHDRGGAARLCPFCCSASRVVALPGEAFLAPLVRDRLGRVTTPTCCRPRCPEPAARRRPWGRGSRGLCEVHACAYAARQAGAQPFTTDTRRTA